MPEAHWDSVTQDHCSSRSAGSAPVPVVRLNYTRPDITSHGDGVPLPGRFTHQQLSKLEQPRTRVKTKQPAIVSLVQVKAAATTLGPEFYGRAR